VQFAAVTQTRTAVEGTGDAMTLGLTVRAQLYTIEGHEADPKHQAVWSLLQKVFPHHHVLSLSKKN